jgi:NTP pyrophosphatase (non-canonical NTP hydrolase)
MEPSTFPPQITQRWERAVEHRQSQLNAARQSFADLFRLMADLRGPGGCPWDREQSLASLRQYVLEEAQEVVAAVERILDYEDGLRHEAGLPAADPEPPEGVDQARTSKKGHSIAHHPHRGDFRAEASAAGAPLPEPSAEQQQHLDNLYAELVGELGDLALQSFFMGDILHAMGRPGIEGSLSAIVEKLVRRHPHVYGDTEASSSAEVLSNWEKIKEQEKLGPSQGRGLPRPD